VNFHNLAFPTTKRKRKREREREREREKEKERERKYLSFVTHTANFCLTVNER
jgi:hypothetical protein